MTQDSINFTIDNDTNRWQGVPGKYGNSGNIWNLINSGVQKSVKPFVNAVEIDWNGAQIGES